MARPSASLAACWLLSFGPLSLVGARAPLPANKKADRYGDPLPPGAVARLGTVRLRGSAAVFTPDSKTIATARDHQVHIWDVKTGGLRRRIPLQTTPWLMGFSPDGKRLATSRYAGIEIEVGRRDGETGLRI
jgi:WD40 repeat protein